MYIEFKVEFKNLLVYFYWTNNLTIQMSLDFILYSTTNLHSCPIRTLVDVLAQILDIFWSSRDLNIEITIKEKEKLRAVRDHILISELGPIVFKNQAIVRPSKKWIAFLSPIYSFSKVLRKVFTISSINHTLGLGIVSTT